MVDTIIWLAYTCYCCFVDNACDTNNTYAAIMMLVVDSNMTVLH